MRKTSNFMTDVLAANTDATVTIEAPVVASTKPRTLAEKIEATKKLLAKYEAEANAETIKDDTEINDAVTFNFGRGDKVRSLTGNIVAIKDDEKLGRLLKVLSGEGFEAETFTVHIRAITSNTTADARKAVAAPAGATISESGAVLPQTTVEMEQMNAAAVSGDPLNAA